jgi:hypothetical protein
VVVSMGAFLRTFDASVIKRRPIRMSDQPRNKCVIKDRSARHAL